MQNTNGYDVIFTSDAGCSTKLNHEVETYNPSTGAVNYWVKVPTVSHTTDTVIYMCYGNASITTDQSNRNGVWDSSYKGVWHLNDNAASTAVADSTSQATNGTSTANTNARTVSGKTSNGLAFNGSDDRVAIGNGVVDANGNFTISAWAYIADTSHNQYSIMGGTVPGSIWGYFILIHRADKGGLTFQHDVNGNGALFTTPSANMTATTWTHVVLVRDRANGHVKIYQNGVQITDAAINPSFNDSLGQGWAFGSWAATWAANNWNGRLDEVRLSSSVRSADWVTTEYNNQNSPSTFYTISEASGGAAAIAGIHWLVTDHLGTPRIILDESGSLAAVSRHDYLPFGEELFAGTGGRTAAQGYTANDNVRQKFTGYEHDSETGLDFAQARYYASIQGRFVSPDNFLNATHVSDPQSWNLYTYVGNNPLTFVDPTGEKGEIRSTYDQKTNTTTITISASFAVYAAKGQNVSKADLNAYADKLEKGIKDHYSKSFSIDGRNFVISADVSANTADSQDAAIESGADNIVELGNQGLEGLTFGQSPQSAEGLAFRLSGENFDRMVVQIGQSFNYEELFAHEFSHLLGTIGHTRNDPGGLFSSEGNGTMTETSFKHLFLADREYYDVNQKGAPAQIGPSKILTSAGRVVEPRRSQAVYKDTREAYRWVRGVTK